MTTNNRELVFVTGGSGHVGANLVRALLDEGKYRVRCLVRAGSNNTALDGLKIDVVEGDLRDVDSLVDCMRDCSLCFHVAAFVSTRFGDREELFAANILGTRNLMLACAEVGVRRVVYTSSFGAVENAYPHASTEESIFNPYARTTDYETSKGFAEGEALRVAAQTNVELVIVNPSGVVGGHDYKPSMVGKTVIDFCTGNMKAYVPGGFDFVPVKDVVQGHLLAMERGRNGHRYLLTGEWISLETFLEILEEASGVAKPTLKIPVWLISRVAIVKDWFERTLFPDAIPRFTEGSIYLLNCGKYGDNTKAQRELGLKPTPIRDAIHEHVQWFVQNGVFTVPKLKAKL